MNRNILGSCLVVGLALLGSPLAGSSPGKVSSGSEGPWPPSSSGGTLTGSYSNPELGTLSFTLTGADLKLKPGTLGSYEGTSTGDTIAISGQYSITINPGYVSYIGMSAKIGEQAWHWPATAATEEVRGRTVSQSFNVTFKIGSSKMWTQNVVASIEIRVCGGICSGYAIDATITFKKPSSSAPPKPSAPAPAFPTLPTPPPDSPPLVRAYPLTQVLKPATYGWLPYAVSDASAKAKVHGTLFQGGTPVLEGGTKNWITADGRIWRWKARLAADLKGPLYFCLWAENPAGKQSIKAPQSSCAFLSFLVDIDRVSNNCGGKAGGDVGRWIQNGFGNKSTFKDPDTGRSFTVDFADACDLHDAGYGGYAVVDKINGGVVDYHSWSRERVDRKFQEDMKTLCRKQIPPSAKRALLRCLGGDTRFQIVRTIGWKFFDADLTKPDFQREGPRDNS